MDRDNRIPSPDQNVGGILNLGCFSHRDSELLDPAAAAPMASPGNLCRPKYEQLGIVGHHLQKGWKVSIISKLIDPTHRFDVWMFAHRDPPGALP